MLITQEKKKSSRTYRFPGKKYGIEDAISSEKVLRTLNKANVSS